MPENTDVRNISYRRKKRLTEALSGESDILLVRNGYLKRESSCTKETRPLSHISLLSYHF